MQGKNINGFELKRLLGVGGMAEVWYAENEIHKAAAVKVLNPDLSLNASIVERFRNEAEIMVRLDHRNIRQVYGYGLIDGRPAIIMEYLEGDDLKTRMKKGQRFSDAQLIKWWNQLVEALNYTHSKGIIHRDIKPGNIFVDVNDNIKLLDFGISKVREGISSTQTGQKLGTLMYMSPEQVKDSKHIDYHTDIYSLAVTFVHLVTGKKPYDSDTSSDFEIQLSIVTKPLDLNGVPEQWRAFLEPYLEKEPSKRNELKHFETIKTGTTIINRHPIKTNTEKITGNSLELPKLWDIRILMVYFMDYLLLNVIMIYLRYGEITEHRLFNVIIWCGGNFILFVVLMEIAGRIIRFLYKKIDNLPWRIAIYSLVVFALVNVLLVIMVGVEVESNYLLEIVYLFLPAVSILSFAGLFLFRPSTFKALPYIILAVNCIISVPRVGLQQLYDIKSSTNLTLIVLLLPIVTFFIWMIIKKHNDKKQIIG